MDFDYVHDLESAVFERTVLDDDLECAKLFDGQTTHANASPTFDVRVRTCHVGKGEAPIDHGPKFTGCDIVQ